MHFERFDLNMLVALDTLLREKSVTRASQRMHITQPALSGTLQRLREYFNDPLLVRIGREMELTPHGQALVEPVREALLRIRGVLETQPEFDPATAKRVIRVAMSDFCTFAYLPHVVRRLSAQAPAIRLEVETGLSSSLDRLDAGDIDLCITHSSYWNMKDHESPRESFLVDPLFSDHFVCVVAQDHPLQDRMTLDDYLRLPHAVGSLGEHAISLHEVALRRYGLTLNVQVVLPGFTGLMLQLAGTPLVATVPSRLATLLSQWTPVRVFPPPLEIQPVEESLLWHARNDADPGHAWVRALLKQVAAELQDEKTSQDVATASAAASARDQLAPSSSSFR